MPRKNRYDYLLPNLLVFPMISHWILPDGIERTLYCNILDITFYLPNVCYLLYLLFYRKHEGDIESTTKKYIKYVAIVLFAFAIFQLLTIIPFSQLPTTVNIILCNFSFIYFPILFICFPLSRNQAEKTKYLIIFAALFLSFQFILYGTGILSYTSAEGGNMTDNRIEIAGIFRIITTAGGSTGAAILLCLLGIIITSYYDLRNLIRLIIIVIITIAVFFSMSRGGLITWLLYLLLLLYLKYLRHKKSVYKIRAVFIAAIVGCILYNQGVFTPILERSQQLDELSTGRDERWTLSIGIFTESQGWGVGTAQVFPDKSISEEIHSKSRMAPHNTFLIYLAELGIFGFVLILLIYLIIFIKMDYRSIVGKMFVFVVLINFNTEGCITQSEFLSLIFFYVMCAMNTKLDRMDSFARHRSKINRNVLNQ